MNDVDLSDNEAPYLVKVLWNHGILWLSIQLGISSSQLTNSYFSEGLKPPTSDIFDDFYKHGMIFVFKYVFVYGGFLK